MYKIAASALVTQARCYKWQLSADHNRSPESQSLYRFQSDQNALPSARSPVSPSVHYIFNTNNYPMEMINGNVIGNLAVSRCCENSSKLGLK